MTSYFTPDFPTFHRRLLFTRSCADSSIIVFRQFPVTIASNERRSVRIASILPSFLRRIWNNPWAPPLSRDPLAKFYLVQLTDAIIIYLVPPPLKQDRRIRMLNSLPSWRRRSRSLSPSILRNASPVSQVGIASSVERLTSVYYLLWLINCF